MHKLNSSLLAAGCRLGFRQCLGAEIDAYHASASPDDPRKRKQELPGPAPDLEDRFARAGLEQSEHKRLQVGRAECLVGFQAGLKRTSVRRDLSYSLCQINLSLSGHVPRVTLPSILRAHQQAGGDRRKI